MKKPERTRKGGLSKKETFPEGAGAGICEPKNNEKTASRRNPGGGKREGQSEKAVLFLSFMRRPAYAAAGAKCPCSI